MNDSNSRCNKNRFSALVVSRLANDLRVTLAVLASCVDYIRGSIVVDERIQERWADVDAAIESIFYVSRELLDVARPHPPDRGVADLNEVVDRMQWILQRLIGERSRLLLDLSAEAPFVQADAVLLEWVLFNLAMNAAEAMPDGGVLEISTAIVVADGEPVRNRRARVSVRDAGSGINGHAHDRAFEPFFTTMPGRLGLGLTSAAMTVTHLGGAIFVEDNEPQGTRIDIYLPLLGSI